MVPEIVAEPAEVLTISPGISPLQTFSVVALIVPGSVISFSTKYSVVVTVELHNPVVTRNVMVTLSEAFTVAFGKLIVKVVVEKDALHGPPVWYSNVAEGSAGESPILNSTS